MPPNKKRKLDALVKHVVQVEEIDTSNGNGLQQTLKQTVLVDQDPTLAPVVGARPSSSRSASSPEKSSRSGSVDQDPKSSEWTIVESKRQKRKKAGDGRTKYPELNFTGRLQHPIKLDELQKLILYTFADGPPPSWTAFKHSGHTAKIVCLMVPGLEMSMFDQIGSFDGAGDGFLQQDKADTSAAQQIKDLDTLHSRPQGNPRKLSEIRLDASLKLFATVFDQVWPVKAPGDTKYNRLHSPVQTLLVAPPSQSQEDKKMKGPRPARESQSFQPSPTSVTEFVLSPEELREAEYPLHPASCETADDLALEQERRKQLNRSAESGWIDTPVSTEDMSNGSALHADLKDSDAGFQVLSVDCEMVLTVDDVYSLARVSIIDWAGKTVLDELVKPSLAIKNYYTQYSGMTQELLDPVMTTLFDVQAKILHLITPTTIICGHSLESDFSALKMIHPHVIDTSLLYPHPRGPPLRSSLKFLTQKYLRREIQKNGTNGHDSVEDSLAVLDLIKLKCEKGPKWGTSEMSGETIFRRLSRAKDREGRVRTSAIIDYGTPERGFGKDATHAIGCKNDDEIVQGIRRAVTGDDDGHVIKGGGVDFIWARLRELETFRGWSSFARDYGTVDPSESTTGQASKSEHSPAFEVTPTPNLSSTLHQTAARIHSIHTSLPPTTLFILYSGTGDPREVLRLQALQRQLKKEYQVKKWDELSVKWTDAEEQGLRQAVESARAGLAFMCVK